MEEELRKIIGDLVFQLAALRVENTELRNQIETHTKEEK